MIGLANKIDTENIFINRNFRNWPMIELQKNPGWLKKKFGPISGIQKNFFN